MFAQQINSTKATPARHTRRYGRRLPISNSRSGTIEMPTPSLSFGKSRASAVAIPSSSACARAGVVSLDRRATVAYQRAPRHFSRRLSPWGRLEVPRLHRNPHAGAVGERKAGRHHADDGEGLAIGAQDLAEDTLVTSEQRVPDLVADYRLVHVAAGPIVLGLEEAAANGRHAEQAQDIGVQISRGHDLGRAIAQEAQIRHRVGADARERPRHAAVILHVEQRHAARGVAFLRVDALHAHELLGLGIGVRPQQDRVHETVDRRRGADAETQGEDQDAGESRARAKCAPGIPKVSSQAVHLAAQCLPHERRAGNRNQPVVCLAV